MKHAPEALFAFGLLVAGSLGQDNDDLPSVVDDRCYAVATLCVQRTSFYTCALLALRLWSLAGASCVPDGR